MRTAREDLKIRHSAVEDMTALNALFRRSYPVLLKPDYPPSVMVTAVPLISRAQKRLVSSGTYFVAEQAGEIVGAGGWTRQAPQGQGETAHIGHVRHVVTDHRRARQGIGEVLLRRVMADAVGQGVRVLHCQSTRTAVPFYKFLGFSVVQSIEITLQPGIVFPAIAMAKRL